LVLLALSNLSQLNFLLTNKAAPLFTLVFDNVYFR
jgi:hypothetical protein